MITWLFTQVWLWSLAAFVLGAFFSWLLFTRPAKRRLKQVLAREREHYDDGYYAEDPAYQYEGRHHQVFDDEPYDPADEQRAEFVGSEQPHAVPGFGTTAAPSWVAAEPPEPVDPVVAEPDTVAHEQVEAGGNTWFRRWDDEQVAETAVQPRIVDEPQAEPPQPEQDRPESDRSGQLRSLFAPVEGGNPAGETGYVPPLGADATTVLPKIPPEPEPTSPRQVNGEIDLGELPQRTPAAKNPDTPKAEVPHIPDALRQRAQVTEPGTGGPADIKPAENLDGNSELPKRTPGVNPHPGKENGPLIKGHSASRQYHSPDSPQYDDIVADVWFRTPADAETAGFTPWHGGSR